jgi:hypothetical protein
MMTVADDEDRRDWAADWNGEGCEQAVRDGGDNRVVMMAVAAEDSDSRWRRQRQTTTVADNNGMRDWAADYEGDGQEQAARDGGDTEWQWWLWRWKMAAVDDDSGGRQQWRRQTTTAVNDNSGGRRRHPRLAADYEGEGGEQAANNNGVRARRAESMKK